MQRLGVIRSKQHRLSGRFVYYQPTHGGVLAVKGQRVESMKLFVLPRSKLGMGVAMGTGATTAGRIDDLGINENPNQTLKITKKLQFSPTGCAAVLISFVPPPFELNWG